MVTALDTEIEVPFFLRIERDSQFDGFGLCAHSLKFSLYEALFGLSDSNIVFVRGQVKRELSRHSLESESSPVQFSDLICQSEAAVWISSLLDLHCSPLKRRGWFYPKGGDRNELNRIGLSRYQRRTNGHAVC